MDLYVKALFLRRQCRWARAKDLIPPFVSYFEQTEGIPPPSAKCLWPDPFLPLLANLTLLCYGYGEVSDP